jgi:hypothetical protein
MLLARRTEMRRAKAIPARGDLYLFFETRGWRPSRRLRPKEGPIAAVGQRKGRHTGEA